MFRRARHDRRLMGVCGGFAHTYGVSPTGVRVVTVILAVAIPGPSLVATLIVYLLLGLLLDETDEY